MFFKYLGRELTKRKRQSALVATGLAIAIALVVVVNSVSGGIKSAQAQALSGLYGIGTDISVSKTSTPGNGGPQHFDVGGNSGSTSGTKRTFSRSMLRSDPFTGTLTQAEVDAIAKVSGVTAVVSTLKLNSVTFNGTLPTFTQNNNWGTRHQGGPGQASSGGTMPAPPTGGSDGNGGSSFNVTSMSVEGVSVATQKIGPLAAVTVTSGRNFTSADAAQDVAVLDASYANANKYTVGKVLTIGGTKFTVVGIISSNSTSASTPSNAYLPIDVAQTLSSNAGNYSNVYVSANSSANLAVIKAAIKKAVPAATVKTSAELASTVSGSLASAASLVNNMGGWLSVIVLLASFGTSILFTTSGVNRRIREFGTLKAIGWRSRRVVGQVVGESLVNGLIGGAIGLLLGLGGVWAVNNWAPTLSASIAQATGFGGPGGPGGGFGGGFGHRFGGSTAAAATNVTLHATIDPTMILVAIGFAVLGGLLAGLFGGLRASRLSPSVALRSFE
jgi:ABC-type antimicrobial peptide transport system permease subunit